MTSGWNVWMWLQCIGVVNGYCCKKIYRFPHNITYLYTPLVLALFCSCFPTSLFIFKMFFHCCLCHYLQYSKCCSKNFRDHSKIEITWTWRYNYNKNGCQLRVPRLSCVSYR